MSDIGKIFADPGIIPGNDATVHLIENGQLVSSLVYQIATASPANGVMDGLVRAMDAQVVYSIDVMVEWTVPFHKVAKQIDGYATLLPLPCGSTVRSNSLYLSSDVRTPDLSYEYTKIWHTAQSVMTMVHLTQDGRVRFGVYGRRYMEQGVLDAFWTDNIAPFINGAQYKTVDGTILPMSVRTPSPTPPPVKDVKEDGIINTKQRRNWIWIAITVLVLGIAVGLLIAY